MRPSPQQIVKKSFETRAKLVAQLVESIDKLRGDTSAEEVKSRLMGLSNKKLLRLHRVEQTVRERFGDREKLVAHIIDARKKGGLTVDDAFRAKLETYPKGRLLDMTHAKHGEAQAKQTPEEKLKAKRGRKQKDRAKSAGASA